MIRCPKCKRVLKLNASTKEILEVKAYEKFLHCTKCDEVVLYDEVEEQFEKEKVIFT